MTNPTDEEIAAALVAIQHWLEAERAAAPPIAPLARWRLAARLEAQGVAPGGRPAAHWGNVERLKRAGR